MRTNALHSAHSSCPWHEQRSHSFRLQINGSRPASICFASLVGFTNASQRDRLEAFIRKSIRLGFCSENIGSFQSMCEASDKQFFDAIKNNPSNILNHLLQSKPSSGYELRPREHNYMYFLTIQLDLADCNFINRSHLVWKWIPKWLF